MTYVPRARNEIARLRRIVDDEIARAENPEHELDLRADLAKFCCMRTTGYFEQSLLVIGHELLRRMSSGVPQDFGLSFLDKSFNPTSEAVLKYVGRFNATWRDDVEALLAEDERGQDLNALVGTRNQIAHGLSQAISIQRVKEHLLNVQVVIDFLLDRFHPR